MHPDAVSPRLHHSPKFWLIEIRCIQDICLLQQTSKNWYVIATAWYVGFWFCQHICQGTAAQLERNTPTGIRDCEELRQCKGKPHINQSSNSTFQQGSKCFLWRDNHTPVTRDSAKLAASDFIKDTLGDWPQSVSPSRDVDISALVADALNRAHNRGRSYPKAKGEWNENENEIQRGPHQIQTLPTISPHSLLRQLPSSWWSAPIWRGYPAIWGSCSCQRCDPEPLRGPSRALRRQGWHRRGVVWPIQHVLEKWRLRGDGRELCRKELTPILWFED